LTKVGRRGAEKTENTRVCVLAESVG
jgi:hypothetical protein